MATKTPQQKALDKARREQYENLLISQFAQAGLPEPRREFVFHPKRKWRFDLSWPDKLIAVEIDGGVYNGGRHTRGKGFEEDCIKINEAQALGWQVYRFSTGQVTSRAAITFLLEKVFAWE